MGKDIPHATRAARAVQPRVAELIVDAPLLVVGEDLVRLVHLFEFRLRSGVARVPVRMMFERLSTVGFTKLVARGLA